MALIIPQHGWQIIDKMVGRSSKPSTWKQFVFGGNACTVICQGKQTFLILLSSSCCSRFMCPSESTIFFSLEVLVQNNQIASKSFQTEFSKALTLRHAYYPLNNAQIFPETYSSFLTALKNLSDRSKSSVFDSLTLLVKPLTACNYN